MYIELSDIISDHRFLILIDVRGFSELPNDQQVQVIQALTNESQKLVTEGGYEKEKIFSSFIPTGDGFYLVGHEMISLIWSQICFVFALSLRNTLIQHIKSLEIPCQGIKVAIHFGTTESFIDIAGHRNYVGTGMNEVARLLSPTNNKEIKLIAQEFYGHENSIIVSQEALNKVEILKMKGLRLSNTFTLQAKHKQKFLCRFIDLPKEKVYHVIST